MNGGWIKLSRSIMDDPLYFAEPFTRAQAWIDLLLLANYADGYFIVRGNRVNVKRGQIGRSQQNLAERWRWSRGKVDRFLTEMENDGRIIQQKSRLTSLISIVNFESMYSTVQQNEQQTAQQNEQQTAQQITQQTDINNKKNNRNNNNTSSIEEDREKPQKRFVPPTLEEVQAYIVEKGYCVDAESFIAFYDSKNWYIGKNKMKNWKAAILTWEKRERENPRRHESRRTKTSESRNVNDEWN